MIKLCQTDLAGGRPERRRDAQQWALGVEPDARLPFEFVCGILGVDPQATLIRLGLAKAPEPPRRRKRKRRE